MPSGLTKMINDEIAEKICVAVIKHRHILCTQRTWLDANRDAIDFDDWLKSYDVIHEFKKTSQGMLVRLWDGRSICFSPYDNTAATLGRTIFDITEYQ